MRGFSGCLPPWKSIWRSNYEQRNRKELREIDAYSLETVVAEKLHAVVDLADQSSRMKDYYDLYQILKTRNLDSDVLQEAIARTFENRHTPYDPDTMFFRDDFGTNPQMETRWRAFIKKITSKSDLQFSEVVTYLQEKLLPYWKNLNH